jgi:hypothetical protein
MIVFSWIVHKPALPEVPRKIVLQSEQVKLRLLRVNESLN